jgi:hypothetical protein
MAYLLAMSLPVLGNVHQDVKIRMPVEVYFDDITGVFSLLNSGQPKSS